jgi:hypothetical protein
MKIAFDLGGVLSKYPNQFRQMILALSTAPDIEVHVITDQHDRDYTLQQLKDNGFGMIPAERIYNADYAKYGEMCKAVIIYEHKIDMLVDDFPGYMVWDYRLGPAPIRLHLQSDPYTPYWSKDWVTRPEDGEFGRRVCPPFEGLVKEFDKA